MPPDAHSHTGFFLRMATGIGYLATSTTFVGPTATAVDAAGGAFALDIAVGGALSPGIILAGSFSVQAAGDARLTNDTRLVRRSHDPNLSMLAAMFDVYPNPKGGFHVGGALGFASLRMRADSSDPQNPEEQSGFGIVPHVGYEWWVGNYWGIGVLGRFLYARTTGDSADGRQTDNSTGAAVMFSATYN